MGGYHVFGSYEERSLGIDGQEMAEIKLLKIKLRGEALDMETVCIRIWPDGCVLFLSK